MSEISNNDPSDKIIQTLKAYAKLCSKPANRAVILKDTTFLTMISAFLSDSHPTAVTHVVKCLLFLTERKEDAISLSAVVGFEDTIGKASEGPFSPSVLHNLLLVSSRIRTAKNQTENRTCIRSDECAVAELPNGGGTLHRKFISRKSKQLIYQFDELTEELKGNIEKKVLSKKGVISVYFNMVDKRVVMRTVLTIESQDMEDVMFDCGCEVISQVVRIEGVEELFTMYASERRANTKCPLPDYLDDVIDNSDPRSCVVTNEYSKGQQSGGWLSSISSFVKGTLW